MAQVKGCDILLRGDELSNKGKEITFSEILWLSQSFSGKSVSVNNNKTVINLLLEGNLE